MWSWPSRSFAVERTMIVETSSDLEHYLLGIFLKADLDLFQ